MSEEIVSVCKKHGGLRSNACHKSVIIEGKQYYRCKVCLKARHTMWKKNNPGRMRKLKKDWVGRNRLKQRQYDSISQKKAIEKITDCYVRKRLISSGMDRDTLKEMDGKQLESLINLKRLQIKYYRIFSQNRRKQC